MSKTTLAKIERISPLTDKIIELILSPESYIDYKAGQYLQILSDNIGLSYSIANAPLGSKTYELHIRHEPNSNMDALFARFKKTGHVSISLPYGECHIDCLAKDKPLIFIAGGTGFAPIKAIIEQLLANGEPRIFELYWGARSQSDLYMDEKVKQWQSHVKQFQYFSLISTTSKTKLAHTVLDKHSLDLNNYQIIIAGPFDMVYAIRDELKVHGVSPAQLFSDAFSFEKKE